MNDKPGEFDIIRRYFAPLAKGYAGAYDLRDDTARIEVGPDQDMMITTDCLVAGVHFFDTDPPETIATKLVAVNMSDLASMGAKPHVCTLATAWPQGIQSKWIERFAVGLQKAQQQYGFHVIGGDTVATSGPMTLTLTAIGLVTKGRGLLRSTAAGGDLVYVSGTIGDAALGLDLLQDNQVAESLLGQNEHDFLVSRYRQPTARVELGLELAEVASACIDISDGLIADLGHLVEASGLNAEIQLDNIPMSAPAQKLISSGLFPQHRIFAGGDDYELLFTVPAGKQEQVSTLLHKNITSLTKIGMITDREEGVAAIRLLDSNGMDVKLKNTGYRHF